MPVHLLVNGSFMSLQLSPCLILWPESLLILYNVGGKGELWKQRGEINGSGCIKDKHFVEKQLALGIYSRLAFYSHNYKDREYFCL